MMPESVHPDEKQLFVYATSEQGLSASEIEQLAVHIRNCRYCQDRAEGFRFASGAVDLLMLHTEIIQLTLVDELETNQPIRARLAAKDVPQIGVERIATFISTDGTTGVKIFRSMRGDDKYASAFGINRLATLEIVDAEKQVHRYSIEEDVIIELENLQSDSTIDSARILIP